VHGPLGPSEFSLAETDSVTFYDSPSMVGVPPGTFMMGQSETYCGDEHEVTLTRDFNLGQFEVTNRQYLESLQWAFEQGLVNASQASVRDNLDGSVVELVHIADPNCELTFDGGGFSLRDAGHGINPDHPVFLVTWFGAARYCDWLSLQAGLPRAYEHSGDWACNGGDPYGATGYRLPTDAEWEYAAQYNDDRTYPWGNETPDCNRANFRPGGYCVGWTSQVGSYPAAPDVLGLFDLAGNVYEWCNDWHDCHLGDEPAVDPTGLESGTDRALHGGGWDRGAADLSSAVRGFRPPDYASGHLGFRVVRSASD